MDATGFNNEELAARKVAMGEGSPSTDVIARIRQYSSYYPMEAGCAIEELIRRFEIVSAAVDAAVESMTGRSWKDFDWCNHG